MLRPPSLPSIVVAALALAGLARPAAAFTREQAKAPMTVTLVRGDAAGCGPDCPEWLAVTGRIGFESPARLADALARLGRRRVPVLLDSPGGESRAGLAMGRMLRARSLDTAVASTTLTSCDAADRACQGRLRAGQHPGHVGTPLGVNDPPVCASACVFVLSGGVDRSVPYGAFVGVHQAKQVLTFRPVMNMFRVLSRIVGGRKVEVSRTLVSTRALPVRVVTNAAPQSLYSEFDRTLLGFGIDESIMPLMRATPPSGIHWLTASELTATRVANDTTDATTLAEREAAVQAVAARPPGLPLAVALTLGDARRWTGFVTWHVDAAVPGAPALVGDWEVPSRHLRGSLSIAPDPSPGATDAFKLLARFASGPGADSAKILTVKPPQLCDPSGCVPFLAGPVAFGRPEAAFGVIKPWRADFLKAVYRRDWISTNVRTDEGEGLLTLSLSSLDQGLILDWERVCCGAGTPDASRGPPPAGLPTLPANPEPSVVANVRPVRPAAVGVKPRPRTLEMAALFDPMPKDQHGYPMAVRGSVTWFPLAAAAGGPGATVLLGAADLAAAGLRVSVEAGASRPGVLGRLTVRLHILTAASDIFGPVTRVVAMNGFDADGHPMLTPVTVEEPGAGGGGFEIHLDVPETGPIAGAFQVGFEDAKGRRVTLALPFDPPIAALLQAAARRGETPGS